jgi:hypothetical protein
MLQAVQVSLLCQILDAGGGGGGGSQFVLKAGDTMTGKLQIDLGANAAPLDTVLRLEMNNLGFTDNYILCEDSVGADAFIVDQSGNCSAKGAINAQELDIFTDAINQVGLKFVFSAVSNICGFFGVSAVQQVSGANLTNNVTVGGVNDTIADFTSLTVYATDAAAIRNDIYQLARKVKQINDGLRAYGLLT